MTAEGWAWIAFGVFAFWFVTAFWSGFYHGIAESWASNFVIAFLSAIVRTAQTAFIMIVAAALATGVRVLWL